MWICKYQIPQENQPLATEIPVKLNQRFWRKQLGKPIPTVNFPAKGTQFVYHHNQLVAEIPLQTDGNAALAENWEEAIYWLYQDDDFTPTARLHKGELHYTVSDQIGTITELMSENGYIHYRQKLNLWGEIQAETLHHQRASNDEIICNFRFVGQYADEESGLYYNRFRYYSPETGQYVSSDPIGLLGGFNPYGYVFNPTEWVDPLGLAPCPKREVNGTTIYGTGQKDGTPGHDQFSEVLANKMAMSGKFKEIYLNRSYNKALGQGGARRPDIMAIDRNGRVHAIELASKTDMGRKLPSLTTRNQKVMRSLPKDMQGNVLVLEHPYKATEIKFRMDNLIGDIE